MNSTIQYVELADEQKNMLLVIYIYAVFGFVVAGARCIIVCSEWVVKKPARPSIV